MIKEVGKGAQDAGAQMDPFTVQEIENAVKLGKPGKSVGVDQIPQKLLLEIIKSQNGLQELTQFCNIVFKGDAISADWDFIVLSLLAKVPKPQSADQLRRVALGSHVYKSSGRAVMMRLTPSTQLTSPNNALGLASNWLTVLLRHNKRRKRPWSGDNRSVCWSYTSARRLIPCAEKR